MNCNLYQGDCLDVMRNMGDNTIDSIVTDPPYGLSFMGKDWDHGVPGVAYWQEALRVAKPGAFLLAFGGTRTYHRLMVAIEDAGWQIRDCIMWVYGSGFPKSANISKLLDKQAGAEREVVGESANQRPNSERGNGLAHGTYGKTWDVTAPATEAAQAFDGYGTALKPAWEPIIVAMKPTDGTYANNALAWGLSGLNIERCRVPTSQNDDIFAKNPHTQNRGKDGGWCTSGSNGAGYIVPNGRWPANLIHDGSDEVMELFPVTATKPGSTVRNNKNNPYGSARTWSTSETPAQQTAGYADMGRAARFFYCAKASTAERNAGLDDMEKRQKYAQDGRGGSHEIFTSQSANDDDWAKKNPNHPQANVHPTVKPQALMRYLCRLVKTPTGGTVLDPFMGSGSTGVAAISEGMDFVGIDLMEDYLRIAQARIRHAEASIGL